MIGCNMKGGYIKFYNKQIKLSKKFLIEDLFFSYSLIEEYESEIKILKKKLKKVCKKRDEFEKLYFDLFDKDVGNEKRNERKKIQV